MTIEELKKKIEKWIEGNQKWIEETENDQEVDDEDRTYVIGEINAYMAVRRLLKQHEDK